MGISGIHGGGGAGLTCEGRVGQDGSTGEERGGAGE